MKAGRIDGVAHVLGVAALACGAAFPAHAWKDVDRDRGQEMWCYPVANACDTACRPKVTLNRISGGGKPAGGGWTDHTVRGERLRCHPNPSPTDYPRADDGIPRR